VKELDSPRLRLLVRARHGVPVRDSFTRSEALISFATQGRRWLRSAGEKLALSLPRGGNPVSGLGVVIAALKMVAPKAPWSAAA
jgi:hypothetical protein